MIQAESNLQATRAQYGALMEEGKSESQNLDAFEAQRRHEYEMRKASVFQELASSTGTIVVSGDTGERLLQQLVDVSASQSDLAVAKKK